MKKKKKTIYKLSDPSKNIRVVAEPRGICLPSSSAFTEEQKRKLELLAQISEIAKNSKYKIPKDYKKAYHIHLRKKYG